MEITCNRCSSVLRVDDSKIPATGAFARCPKCGHKNFVRRGAIQAAPGEKPARTKRPGPGASPVKSKPDESSPSDDHDRPPDKSRSLGSIKSENFRTTFLVFFILSGLLPILILLYLVSEHVRPVLTPQMEEALVDPFTFGLLAMLAVPLLSYFLMSWWVKSLEDLTKEIKDKTRDILQDNVKISGKNEIVALGRHIDILYHELQDRITQLNEYAEQLVESKKRLADLSILDEATGLYNRQHFEIMLMNKMKHSDNQKNPLAVMMLQVTGARKDDLVERTNIDFLIRGVAHLLRDYLQKKDLPFRYAQDQVAVILPGTSAKQAAALAQKMAAAAELLSFKQEDHGQPEKICLSFGVTGPLSEYKDLNQAVSRTLAAAESAGKGKVVLLPPGPNGETPA